MVHAEEKAGPLAAALQPFVDQGVLPGAVMLVADQNGVRACEAVGYSDVAAKTPMQVDDLFWIASMSKPMTAVAVMMLVEEGKIDLEAPVAKYLPEFEKLMVMEKGVKGAPPRAPKSPLLVKHLLSMAGGMRFSSEIEKPALDQGTLAERVKSYAATPLDYDPGTHYQYSNASINTAARIVEVVAGEPFEKFLDERLLQPLGMTNTTFWPSEEQLKHLAKSYTGNADKTALEEVKIDQLTYPLPARTRQPMPAGGLFSTAADVAKFGRMMLNGGTLDGKRYLLTDTVKGMKVKHAPEREGNLGYGYGFRTDGRTYGHFGKYGTNLSINTQQGVVYVFMVQNAGWRDPEIGKKISPAFMAAAGKLIGPRKLEARLEQARRIDDTIAVDFVLKNLSKETIRLAERWNSWGADQWTIRSVSDGQTIIWRNPQMEWTKNYLSVLEIPAWGEFRTACLLKPMRPEGRQEGVAVFLPEAAVQLGRVVELVGVFRAELENQGEVSTNWAGEIETKPVKVE